MSPKEQVLRIGKILGLIALAMVVLCLLNFAALKAEAAPLVQATDDAGVTVTLTDEPCKLTSIANMPYRATWRGPKRLMEGCFSVVPEVGLVVMFFDDKTVKLAAVSAFKPLERL